MENLSVDAHFRSIEDNYKIICERIALAAQQSGRQASDIRFMAVTKTVDPIFINHALSLGIDLIGENKVQELQSKMDFLKPASVEKHLIGHLQTNKAAKIVPLVSMIESIDSVKIAEAVNRCAEKLGKTMDILLEVNIGREESKTGFMPEEIEDSARQIAAMPHLHLCGLMTVPPICEDAQESRRFFSLAHQLFIDIRNKNIDNIDMNVLSMGMSHDYYEAILEGATQIRVGSSLFGARHY